MSGGAGLACAVTSVLVYSRLRHLLEWGVVLAMAVVAAPLWSDAMTTSLVDPESRAKVAAFVVLGLALVAGLGLSADLGEVERLRPTPLHVLRLGHATFLAISGATILVVIAGVPAGSILLALIGGQMACAALLPHLPHWLPVLVAFAFMFVLGVDFVRHEFSAWAIWIDPRPLGVITNFAIGLCGSVIWILIGPARSGESG